MTVIRTINLDDISPEELAQMFCEMDSGQQSEFFSHVWTISRAWGGAGWCQQSSWIAAELDHDGRDAVKTLADHFASITGWKPSEA